MRASTRLVRPALLSVVAALAVTAPVRVGAQAAPSPAIDDVLNLKRVGAPALSNDGARVAFTIRETNWDDNAYETEIWVADAASGEPRQLTSAPKSSVQPAWAPDNRTLAFVSDRDGKRQIYRIDVTGGEAEKLTKHDEDIDSFAWSPDGRMIAFTAREAAPEAMKTREKRWGDVRLEDEDQRYVHLHVMSLDDRRMRALTSGTMVVGSFDWSPDGTRIAFDHRVSSDAGESGTADISIVDVSSGQRTALVAQAGPDSNPRWSPDGTRIAFVSAMAKPFYFYQNRELAIVTPGQSGIRSLSKNFDEDASIVAWTKGGLFFSASQRTYTALFSVDSASGAIRRHQANDTWIGSQFSLSADGTRVAFVGTGATEFPDVYAGELTALATARRISDTRAQVAAWPMPAREVIRWKSQDGAEIEGVLHKPASFQTGRRYPLLVVIHGGPTGISRPQPYSSANAYPIEAFLGAGALVLEPNYRGSAGYGEAFRSLNVRNLGIGDAWDVLSGIDHLVAQGLVDRDRVGSMGWSQGGYISAFLTTRHADRFRAISVGAGISDWMTYYVNTDIHPFTRQYLKATPWDDPKIYADTSPMTYIKQAKTPTLIQHGDQDARVPVPNAFQLYQGLRDQEVPVRLSIFKGFGHGLNKPKANRAAMEQNWEFFTKYVLGPRS
ncbi:MAG: S9 family peptidase [Acidobacteria bacterium]|nr:S9 family peptidase [Acidobacteriota bacterium]